MKTTTSHTTAMRTELGKMDKKHANNRGKAIGRGTHMKRAISLVCMTFMLCFCLLSVTGCSPSARLDDILAQAETILSQSFQDAPVVDENHSLPDGVKLTGPFLYIDHLEIGKGVFVPNVSGDDYVPSGMPDGSKFNVIDNESIKGFYPGLITEDADAPVVYALLISTGYDDGHKYLGRPTVYNHLFNVLFIDYASGEIIAQSAGYRQLRSPLVLYLSDVYTDNNGRSVFREDNAINIRYKWRDMLYYASFDDSGAAIHNGKLLAIRNDIKEYIIPNGVTDIDRNAFENCNQLESITFPEGLTEIYASFSACTHIQSITLPEGLTTIWPDVFKECSALSEINFPSTLTTVGRNAFFGTAWLEQQAEELFVIAGDGVLIKANGKGDMSEMVIPDGVKYLAASSLCNITVNRLVLPGTLQKSWGDMSPFLDVTISEIYVSDGVTEIHTGVFIECEGLRRVRLPGSIEEFRALIYDGKENVTVVCPAGSNVYTEAKDDGYMVEAE